MKKKVCLWITICILSLLLYGCGTNKGTCYEQGLKLSAQMSEMANSTEYLSLLTANEKVKEVLSHAAAENPQEPKAVYEIILQEDAVLKLLGLQDTGNLSEPLKANLTARSYGAIASQINAAAGVDALAASALCSTDTSFVDSSFEGNALYLYVYDAGAPVMAVFSSGEDKAVIARGYFIFNESLASKGKEEILDYFQQNGFNQLPIELREIQK